MPIVTPTGLPAGVPDVVRTALPASGYDWGGGIVVDRRPAGGQRQVDRWGSTRSSRRRVFVGGYSRQFALRKIGAAQYPGSGRDGLGVRGLAARRGWVVGLDEHYRSCPLTSPAPSAPKRGRGGGRVCFERGLAADVAGKDMLPCCPVSLLWTLIYATRRFGRISPSLAVVCTGRVSATSDCFVTDSVCCAGSLRRSPVPSSDRVAVKY